MFVINGASGVDVVIDAADVVVTGVCGDVVVFVDTVVYDLLMTLPLLLYMLCMLLLLHGCFCGW